VPQGHIPLERALCVPIVHRDQLLGVITVANKLTEYDREDIEILEGIASKVAMILHSRLQVDREYRARRRAEEALARLKRQLGAEGSFAGIVGRAPRMLDLFETIREVAAVDVPVLILGESGTGKELVAGAIHGEGPRREGPFVPVNCSALPETLLESELFGHVKGAFTGAIRDKKGRFELANDGTIFLDEIGELSPSIQVSLLRALQEGTIERLGDEKIRKVDVRVISATNRDLRKLVATGRFREDLFYRLCVVPINVPPLRERRGDIPILAAHVLRQVTSETGKEVSLSQEVLDALLLHDWPGNVRELQNAIYYAVVKTKRRELALSDLPPGIAAGGDVEPRAKRGRKLKLRSEEVERALRETRGNKLEAARVLGVSRATLYKFLQRN
jgi:transcriptional regulator with GAF, ATPase, and Fis domain